MLWAVTQLKVLNKKYIIKLILAFILLILLLNKIFMYGFKEIL